MSFTNSDLILAALQPLGIVREGARAPSSAQGEHGLIALNNMMFEWFAQGIDLEYSLQTDLTDDSPINEANRQTVIANLCVRVADTYGKPVPQFTAALAGSGYDRLSRDAVLAAQKTLKMDHLPRDTAQIQPRSSILTG